MHEYRKVGHWERVILLCNFFYSFQYRYIHTINSHNTTHTQVKKVNTKIIHDKVLLHIMPHQTGMPILTTLKIFNHKGKFLYYRNGNFCPPPLGGGGGRGKSAFTHEIKKFYTSYKFIELIPLPRQSLS